MTTIRYRIRELMSEWEHTHGEKLSYRKLANESRVSTSTLQRMTHGTNDGIDHETLEKLCSFFGVPLEKLMTDKPESAFW